MEKTRKNFNFDSALIEKAAQRARQSKRSLTSHIEFLIEEDLKKDRDEFFNHMDKHHEDC